MKTMKYLSMLLVMLTMSVCMASCGDDDDEASASNPLIGTWYHDKTETTWMFRADGTGMKSDKSGTKNFSYSYSQEENTVLITYVGSTDGDLYTVQQTGNTLDLIQGSSYIHLEKK